MLIIEHCIASKSCAAVREAFSSAYPDKVVPYMTAMHRQVTTFLDRGSDCL
jgi:hypothetical protein